MYDSPLFPTEEQVVRNAIEKRRREFAAGRACAREALFSFGVSAAAIAARPDRTPIWPRGFTGSIAHCGGFCCAAVASTSDARSIGIDAELAGSVESNIESMVRRDDERIDFAMPASLNSSALFFCAKEALYKCYYQAKSRYLDFKDVSLAFSRTSQDEGEFRVAKLDGPALGFLTGKWFFDGQRIYAAISS